MFYFVSLLHATSRYVKFELSMEPIKIYSNLRLSNDFLFLCCGNVSISSLFVLLQLIKILMNKTIVSNDDYFHDLGQKD